MHEIVESESCVRIVLEDKEGVGHFSRLLPCTEWAEIGEGDEIDSIFDSDTSSSEESEKPICLDCYYI